MIKLFTHNDLDGMSCALLAQLAYGIENVEFETCNYDVINEKVQEYIETKAYVNYSHCFITDISISEEIAELINQSSITQDHFSLIDHHITAIALNKNNWCMVKVADENEVKCSGTSLFYTYLKQQDIPFPQTLSFPIIESYVEKVRRYDTWDWATLEDLQAKQLNDLLYILGKERFMNCWFERLQTPHSKFAFNETELLLLEIRQKEIDKYIEAREEEIIVREVAGYQAGIVFANRFQSELGNKLAELHPELDFIAMINIGGGVSCRTIRDDLNLGTEIASLFGGGGHAKAAGLPVSPEIRELVIKQIFCLDPNID